MAEIAFLYRALSDLLMGMFIIAPLHYIVESSIPRSACLSFLTLFGLLRYIHLPDPVVVLAFGLLWTLFIALSGNTGIGWTR
jgi:hypothetical protein